MVPTYSIKKNARLCCASGGNNAGTWKLQCLKICFVIVQYTLKFKEREVAGGLCVRSCFSQKYQEHRKESTDALSEKFQCELVYVDLLRFLWLMLCFKTRAIIKEKYKLFITLADCWSQQVPAQCVSPILLYGRRGEMTV